MRESNTHNSNDSWCGLSYNHVLRETQWERKRYSQLSLGVLRHLVYQPVLGHPAHEERRETRYKQPCIQRGHALVNPPVTTALWEILCILERTRTCACDGSSFMTVFNANDVTMFVKLMKATQTSTRTFMPGIPGVPSLPSIPGRPWDTEKTTGVGRCALGNCCDSHFEKTCEDEHHQNSVACRYIKMG